MPRKKKKVMSLEVLEINSLWDYRKCRVLRNFICNDGDAEKLIPEMDVREFWKHQTDYQKQVKAILAPAGTRNASCCFYGDEIAYEEAKLPDSVKAATKYIYKIYDYNGVKLNTEYGTQKDAVSYIAKKIKTRNADVRYNGESRRIEFSPKAVTEILNELEETTSQFSIEPVGRSSCEETILVSIFKNCMK